MAEPRERPILFSAPMVKALLAGTKTQTRRLVTRGTSFLDGYASTAAAWDSLDFAGKHGRQPFVDPGPSPAGNAGPYLQVPKPDTETVHRVYPRWFVGDHLWVRETFTLSKGNGHRVLYRADVGTDRWPPTVELTSAARWTPSIFMQHHRSRITLEVTSVRVERLQDISEEDAKAEGVEPLTGIGADQPLAGESRGRTHGSHPHTLALAVLWDTINADRATWASNPWVWVVGFRRLP